MFWLTFDTQFPPPSMIPAGRKLRLSLVLLACCSLTACNARVQPSSSAVGSVTSGAETVQGSREADLSSQENFQADMAIEGEVSDGCVQAWRKALKGDEKGAMAQLDEMSKKYPKVVTVTFMKGQVLDHLGRKAEAAKYYRAAVTDKEFSTIHCFKLAEALRESHQNKEAADEYRRILKSAPEFVPGKIGLAKSLIATDKHSPEARQQLEDAQKIDPKSAEVKQLLQSIN
jgi:predicted Zn-dependent protease